MPILSGSSRRGICQGHLPSKVLGNVGCIAQRLAALLLVLQLLGGCHAESEPADAAVVSGLRVTQVLGGQDDSVAAGFRFADQPRTFVFPRDHGPHPAYRSEWWYLTGFMQDAEGQEYGVQYTLFRQALSPSPTGPGPWHTGQAFLAHLALTDVERQQHYHAQRFSRGHPSLAGVSVQQENPAEPAFQATLEDWSLSGSVEEPLVWQLDAAEGDKFAVSLNFTQTRALVLQGERGWSRKGPEAASYYYSLPRLRTTGEVFVSGQSIPVSGWAWLDREWSTSVLGDHLLGWDWFALQLTDGRSLMVFNLRRKDGQRDPYNHGKLVTAQTSRQLLAEAYELRPQRYWQDPRGALWPVAWQLILRDGSATDEVETLTIEALLDNQLMEMGLIYWEGLVAVYADGQRVGSGYMELTGYGDDGTNNQEF